MSASQAKLNIVYATLRYPPAPGGAEEMMKQIAEGINKRGHQVKILTTDLKIHGGHRLALTKTERSLDASYLKRFRTYQIPNLVYQIAPLMDLDLLFDSYNIIHASHFYHYPADAAWWYSRLRRKPLIFNPFFYIESRQAKKWRIYRKTLGALTMRADCILAITEFEKKLILGSFPKIKRIEVIKPGIDWTEFNRPIEKNLARQKLEQLLNEKLHRQIDLRHQKIIFFAGRICSGKGIDLLIKAAPKIVKQNPYALFILAGENFTAESEGFKQIIGEKKLNNHFIFIGNLERKKLIQAYFAADLFVLPSRYEAFGIVLTEAMAAGLAIVATNHSAIPEVINNGQTGLLFELNNYKDLADKISLVLNDDNLRRDLGQRGLLEAKKYDWQKTVTETEKIYYEYI